MSGLLIVGGSYAASQVAASARQAGYAQPITVVSEEAVLPYQRPPLSKGYLTGATTDAQLSLRSEKFYADNKVELLLGARATKIDRTAKTASLADGRSLGYDKLVLATGARARPLPSAPPGALLLRTVADAQALKARLAEVQTVAVIGGGFIGLEVAGVAVGMGKQVTVYEALDRLLARAVPPQLAAWIADAHRASGMKLVFGAQAADVRADLVVIGIGVLANEELARDCGLACDNGIVVDDHARTADPDIYAAGDCTRHPSRYAGGLLRLESVQNAMDQAKVAGANVAGGDTVYDALPWFWSDQGELKLQMAGLSQGHEAAIVRGSMEEGKFSIFYLREGRLLAADTVNKPGDHMLARRLIAAKVPLTPEQAADVSLDLKALLKA